MASPNCVSLFFQSESLFVSNFLSLSCLRPRCMSRLRVEEQSENHVANIKCEGRSCAIPSVARLSARHHTAEEIAECWGVSLTQSTNNNTTTTGKTPRFFGPLPWTALIGMSVPKNKNVRRPNNISVTHHFSPSFDRRTDQLC